MWRVADNQARLELPQLVAELDLEQPQRGIDNCRVLGGKVRTLQTLQIQPADEEGDLPLKRVDTYLRGTDLIACYANLAQQVRLQLDWRALPATEHAIGGIELVVSVSTECWVRQPRLLVGSQLWADEVRLVADRGTPNPHTQAIPLNVPWVDTSGDLGGGILYRAAELTAFVEMIDPGEYSRLTLTPLTGPRAGCVQSRLRVFEDRLEKGVIRRVRLRGMFLTPTNDTLAALACYRDFRNSELPLTA